MTKNRRTFAQLLPKHETRLAPPRQSSAPRASPDAVPASSRAQDALRRAFVSINIPTVSLPSPLAGRAQSHRARDVQAANMVDQPIDASIIQAAYHHAIGYPISDGRSLTVPRPRCPTSAHLCPLMRAVIAINPSYEETLANFPAYISASGRTRPAATELR